MLASSNVPNSISFLYAVERYPKREIINDNERITNLRLGLGICP